METLQDLVRRRMHELGMTQDGLADRSGMSQEWVSKVYRGRIGTPRRKSLFRLADALGVERETVVMAAGFASTRERAAAMLAALPDDECERLDALHAELDEHLLAMDAADVAWMIETARAMARAAEARRSAGPDQPRPVPPPSSEERTAPPPEGTGSSVPPTDRHSAPCT